MSLTETDIYHLFGKARWTAERASLTDTQLEGILSVVKHPIPDANRPIFKFWLNQAIAQYVDDTRKRDEIPSQERKPKSRRRRSQAPMRRRVPKLSTRARDELIQIRRAVEDLRGLIDDLTRPAKDAIQQYFRSKHLDGLTRVRPMPTFRQTWEHAWEALSHLQVACERPDEVGITPDTNTVAELAAVIRSIDVLFSVIEEMGDPARDVLKWSYVELSRGPSGIETEGVDFESPVGDGLAWLQLLNLIASYPQIVIKRGRDEVPLKTLIRGLAAVYSAMTGREPGRVYRAVETRRGARPGESGGFLELVRMLINFADEAAPGIGLGGETKATWRAVLDDLFARGLRTPDLVIVDGGKGLEAALASLIPEVPVQRCTVHKERNLLAHAPKHLHDEIKADFTDMMYAEDAKAVQAKRKAFLAKWRLRCRGVADSLEGEAAKRTNAERLFTFLKYPPEQWRSLRTTNAIERLHEGEDEPWPKAA